MSNGTRHYVIGAGATLAEALELGIPRGSCPPLMSDFARKTWSNFTPYPVLEAYLYSLGYKEIGHDPRELFFQLEESGVTNIESFIEFAWVNRHYDWKVNSERFPVNDSYENGEFWENFLYHGIGSPLSFFILQCFFQNGECKNLRLSKSFASRLESNDVVLNLNYDTVFEIALKQLGLSYSYSPNKVGTNQILICKPHGSLNMVMNNEVFTFGQPEWLGMPQTPGFNSYSGLIPPRLNKDYSQHPIAKMILAPVLGLKPQRIVMWGVGFTGSDLDLNALYEAWSENADGIDIINPSKEVADDARKMLRCKVRHFSSLSEWYQSFS